jgi:N6-adenosine-specific RNA methylase IME4/anti-sigma28 factor (negative regulator of flagellin synthesis)
MKNIIIDPEFKALIPPLAPEELAQLEANIIKDGCRDPLVVWNWHDDTLWPCHHCGGAHTSANNPCHPTTPHLQRLIDGHNRFDICTRNGIEFQVVEMEFQSKAHARIWMRENQKGRRNLSPAWVIELELGNKADLLEIGRVRKVESGKEARQKQLGVLSQNDNTPNEPPPEPAPKVNTQKEIAKAAGVSTGQIGMAEQVKKKSPELWEKAKNNEVSISAAYKEIKKEEKKAERTAMIDEQKKAIESGEMKLPEGVFEVIAMDPPWHYGREYDPDSSRVANPYPEMTQEQLLALQPPFAKDCVLFLWTTHAFIFDAKQLLNSWGFTYKATMVWDKEKIGMGAWLRMQCEFCLVGIKGKPTWVNTTWRDIIREPRREHSRKPDTFYEMVESITVGRRLEYFSREQRNGWTTYGNDTEKF